MTDFAAAFAQLTRAQQRAFLKEQSKSRKSQMGDADYRQRCREMRPILEDQCDEAGLTFTDVATCPVSDQVWINPANPKETRGNWQKGAKPAWCVDANLAEEPGLELDEHTTTDTIDEVDEAEAPAQPTPVAAQARPARRPGPARGNGQQARAPANG
jgi:hypothetical protein